MTPTHLGDVRLHDGEEPQDLHAPLNDPRALGASILELANAPLARLDEELGAGSVDALAALFPVKPGELDPRRFVDANRLPLFRAYRDLGDGRRALLITSFGEFQPGRYLVILHAVFELGPGAKGWPPRPSSASSKGPEPGDARARLVLAVVGLFVAALVVKSNLDVFAPGVLGLDPASGNCVQTTATVTNTEHTQNRKRTKDRYSVMYRYEASGRTYDQSERVEASLYYRASIGHPIAICVGIDDPSESVLIGNESQRTSRSLVIAVDALLLLGIGWAVVSRLRRAVR